MIEFGLGFILGFVVGGIVIGLMALRLAKKSMSEFSQASHQALADLAQTSNQALDDLAQEYHFLEVPTRRGDDMNEEIKSVLTDVAEQLRRLRDADSGGEADDIVVDIVTSELLNRVEAILEDGA